jgi:hypothetical protein
MATIRPIDWQPRGRLLDANALMRQLPMWQHGSTDDRLDLAAALILLACEQFVDEYWQSKIERGLPP